MKAISWTCPNCFKTRPSCESKHCIYCGWREEKQSVPPAKVIYDYEIAGYIIAICFLFMSFQFQPFGPFICIILIIAIDACDGGG